MSVDRPGNDAGEPDDHSGEPDDHSRKVPPPGGAGLTEDDLPPRQEMASQWQPRDTGGSTNGAWNRDDGKTGNAPATLESGAESQERQPDDSQPGQAADRPSAVEKPSAVEDALLKRIDELETNKAFLDKRLSAQDKVIAGQSRVIAGQGERIERLETYVGQMTTAIREVRQGQGESQPNSKADKRSHGGEAELSAWSEPEPESRRPLLPSDGVNSLIATGAGGALGELALHIQNVTPDIAGTGATLLALAAGFIAVWRDHRKAKKDGDHRPKGSRRGQQDIRPRHPG
jgi:uncharacterized coiled-coil protein SlyX